MDPKDLERLKALYDKIDAERAHNYQPKYIEDFEFKRFMLKVMQPVQFAPRPDG